MLVTMDIEEAALACSKDEKVTFVINQNNKWHIFLFCVYQIKYKTLKDFQHISFEKEKDGLYWLLKTVAFLSFGTYKLTYNYDKLALNK